MLTSASLSVGTRSIAALFRVSGARMHLFWSVMPLMSNGEEKLTVAMIAERAVLYVRVWIKIGRREDLASCRES